MKYCKNCGAPLWEDANFCVECGTKIDKAELEPIVRSLEEPKEEAVPVEVPADTAAESITEPEPEKKRFGWVKIAIVCVAAALLCGIGGWFFAGCHKGSSMAGKWQATNGQLLTIELYSDGTGLLDNPALGAEEKLTWAADDHLLELTMPAYGQTATYEYILDGDQLTIQSVEHPENGEIPMKRKK